MSFFILYSTSILLIVMLKHESVVHMKVYNEAYNIKQRYSLPKVNLSFKRWKFAEQYDDRNNFFDWKNPVFFTSKQNNF